MITKPEYRDEMSKIKSDLALLKWSNFGLAISAAMVRNLVTRFCAVAEAWAQLQGEGSDG